MAELYQSPQGVGTGSAAAQDDLAARAARVDAARVAVLGLNAWLVLTVLPMLLAGPQSWASAALLVLPLPALAFGVSALSRSRRTAGAALLAGYPVLVAIAIGLLGDHVEREPYSPLGLLFGALSLLAYGAGAALAASRPQGHRPTSLRPLGSVQPIPPDRSRVRTQLALIGVTASAATAVAVVAPMLGGRTALVAAWGDAAREAGVLVAVVAGALGTAVVALFVAPAMRASRRRPPTRRQIDARLVALLSVVLTGVLVLFLMHR